MTHEFDKVQAYFAANPPPASLAANIDLAKIFVQRHQASSHRVVLVTSGGTSVPLEKQTVRFIDNFSAGTRGSASAEYFLANGYAVIFLHRQNSLLPFSRHFSPSFNCFLDLLAEDEHGRVEVASSHQEEMRRILARYTDAKQRDMLLSIPFTTVTDYLWNLREIATVMRSLGSSALLYLAAAVSDFFIPPERMAEHKIQSGEALPVTSIGTSAMSDPHDSVPVESKKLMIDLDPVPKFLKTLVDDWAPRAMIASFKLETDPDLLISKSHKALQRYSHHLVIGNLLASRKYEVVLITPDLKEQWIHVPVHQRTKSEGGPLAPMADATDETRLDYRDSEPDSIVEIELMIVDEVAKLHSLYMQVSR